jgi:hypothetical protein
MPDATPPLDPWSADDLSTGRLDPLRAAGLLAADPVELARAIAGLANARGGDVLLGTELDGDGAVVSQPGVAVDVAETALDGALALIDPPVGHLVRARRLDDARVLVVRVRLSPSTPHIVTATGEIPRMEKGGLGPVRSRRGLDDLYARGRGERERADRLVDAMVEKLVLAHYAFYTLAIIACTQDPSGEPYRAAVDGQLAPPDDAFIAAFGLHEHEPRVWPAEIELRTPGDTGAFLRVTRSGAAAAGEVQRRPYHEELDSLTGLESRITALAGATCRILAPAGEAVMVPHLFLEGIRGLRLVRDPATKTTTGRAPQDTTRYALSLGDARDPEYPARLAAEAMERLAGFFPADAAPLG